MTKQTETAKQVQCPSCGNKAKRVSTTTLAAQLHDEFGKQFSVDSDSCWATASEGCASIKNDTGWRFCLSQDCDVVYFSEDGNTTFTKSQLKVPVGVKEFSGDRPLCYCFGHSIASIKDEIRTQGRSDALEDIRAKMKDPGCHCETSNPSGSCCLGSVAKGTEIAQSESGHGTSEMPSSPATASTGRGETIAKVGTVLSAIMASACCWLPLVYLAVGVSGAGIAATLEAYRQLFIMVTFVFLSAAFYFTYRPRKADKLGDCFDPAGEARGIAPTGKRRLNMMTMNKVKLWGVTVLAVAFLFFPSYVGVFLGGESQNVMNNMNQAVIRVEGMTCEGCSAIVAKAIKSTPGVLAVEVNYAKGEAVVGTETCCPVPEAEILASLKDAGYDGAIVTTAAARR